MTATPLKYPSGKFTINPVPRWIWSLIAVPLILFLLFVAFHGYPFNVTPEAVMGFPPPDSATNIQMEVQPKLFGEYDAYLRFEIAADGVDDFLSERFFQPSRQSADAMSVFANAVFGQTPAAEVVAAGRPDWWLSADEAIGGNFTLAYRSGIGYEEDIDGADSAWYIIEQSHADRAVVYVFVREV